MEEIQEKTGGKRRRRITTILGILLAIVVIGVTGCAVTAIYSRPLVLPDSMTIHALTAADHGTLNAFEFVSGLEGTGISVSFGDDYDETRMGQQEITLVFRRGKESCQRTAQLYRFHLEPLVSVKLGQEDNVTARDFVSDERISVQLCTALKKGACGIYDLQIQCDGRMYMVQCAVTEQDAPKGEGREVTVQAGADIAASEFVKNIVDQSPVTVTYQEKPDFTLAGTRDITLVLTDLFGNMTQVQAVLNVVPAENGPRFTGVETLYLELGNAVSYRTGVTATDPQDGVLTFSVDTEDFNSKVPGKYMVLYSAEDSDGNRLVVPRTIVVESHVGQMVRQKAQAVLDEIIQPGMSQDEKIRAVFNKVRYYTYYSGVSDKSSLEGAAYDGFTKWSGDCYTYYAMVKVMLDMLEIPNLEVRRVGGTSNHWWNLVQFEDGKYYHVDATPHTYTTIEHFKMTERVIEEYTKAPEVANRRPNYYVYDHTLPEYQDIEIAQ